MWSRGHHWILCCSSWLARQTVGRRHHAFAASILLDTQPHPVPHHLAPAAADGGRRLPPLLQQPVRRQGGCRLRPVRPSAVDEAGEALGLLGLCRH